MGKVDELRAWLWPDLPPLRVASALGWVNWPKIIGFCLASYFRFNGRTNAQTIQATATIARTSSSTSRITLNALAVLERGSTCSKIVGIVFMSMR